MGVRFSHTIVHSRDKHASARFLATVLGVGDPVPFGDFQVVSLDHDATIDFLDAGAFEFQTQHYAFLVDEGTFDEVYRRVRERGLDTWADPFKKRPGEVNDHDGGRGFYFDDPDGHLLEVHTRRYGSGGA